MAKSNKLPKRLLELAKRNPDRVQSLDVERDEWDGPRSPYSYWMWLKPGWSPDGEVHCIHEPTVREFLEVWRRVRPCECDECEQAKSQPAPGHTDLMVSPESITEYLKGCAHD